jgi:hypothetical protein
MPVRYLVYKNVKEFASLVSGKNWIEYMKRRRGSHLFGILSCHTKKPLMNKGTFFTRQPISPSGAKCPFPFNGYAIASVAIS